MATPTLSRKQLKRQARDQKRSGRNAAPAARAGGGGGGKKSG